LANGTILAFTVSYENALIYLNGAVVVSKPVSVMPSNVTRSVNFIGRSSWYLITDQDQDLDADLDEMKIFSRKFDIKRLLKN